MNEQPKSGRWPTERQVGAVAGVLCLLLAIAIGVGLVEKENTATWKITEYCNTHPDVEMWNSEHGTANCTAWREGKVVAV